MSTRSHIRIKEENGNQYKIYHHFDGYPEGVGLDLRKFLDSYRKYEDNERSVWYGEDIANALVKGKVKNLRRDYEQPDCPLVEIPDMGYEITGGIHGDEEYVYVIDCKEKTLTCYKMEWNETFEEVIGANRVEKIPEPEE